MAGERREIGEADISHQASNPVMDSEIGPDDALNPDNEEVAKELHNLGVTAAKLPQCTKHTPS